MSIIAGITAAKSSLDIAKVIIDLVNRPDIDPAEVKAKVHQLLIHLTDTQLALGEAHIEINDLRHQLDDRESRKALDDDMDFQIDGAFYVRKSEESKGVIAYCPVCWRKDGNIVPMAGTLTAPGHFFCNVHKINYNTAAARRALGS